MRPNSKKAFRLTVEQMRADERREYNPREWDKMIDRYLKYKDVEFIKLPQGDGYGYDRHYAIYTLPSGMRVVNAASYSSSLTSGGFAEAFVFEYDENFNRYEDNRVDISTRKVTTVDDNGNKVECMINNTDEAREYMTRMSVKLGAIWTKEMI